jgi:hypothetical protein
MAEPFVGVTADEVVIPIGKISASVTYKVSK